MIKCSRCKIETDSHYKGDYYCKECRKIKAKETRDRNKEDRNRKRRERRKNDPIYRKHLSDQKKKSYWNNVEKRMFYSIKSRSLRRNLKFEISLEDIKIPEYCPILQIKFDKGRHSPTLDRIIPNKGYIKGNIKVVSKKANTMKNDATLKELNTFKNNIEKYMQSYEEIVQPIENNKSIDLQDKEPVR